MRAIVPTEDLVDTICARLADGESLRAICSDPKLPSRDTVQRWINSDPVIAAKCARAREQSAMADAERMQMLIDAEPERLEDGRIDPGWVQWVRSQISTLQWFASKKAPKQFGDRIAVAGDEDAPLRVMNVSERAARVAAIVESARRRLQVTEGDAEIAGLLE